MRKLRRFRELVYRSWQEGRRNKLLARRRRSTMSRLLSTIISDRPGPKSTANVLLVQSSAAQSAIPIVSAILQKARSSSKDVVLVRALYPLQALEGPASSSGNVKYVDWTLDVPGYGTVEVDLAARSVEVKSAIDNCQHFSLYFT